MGQGGALKKTQNIYRVRNVLNFLAQTLDLSHSDSFKEHQSCESKICLLLLAAVAVSLKDCLFPQPPSLHWIEPLIFLKSPPHLKVKM